MRNGEKWSDDCESLSGERIDRMGADQAAKERGKKQRRPRARKTLAVRRDKDDGAGHLSRVKQTLGTPSTSLKFLSGVATAK